MGASKPPTSPLIWIAGGCGVLVVLYLLLSCVLPLLMYGAMALNGAAGGGRSPATVPVGTPYDIGPPNPGGPMLPPDPNELAAPDGGAGPGVAPRLVPVGSGGFEES